MCAQSVCARLWTHLFAPYAAVSGRSVVSSACAVLILMVGLGLPAFAQGAADDDLLKRGQGLILARVPKRGKGAEKMVNGYG